MNTLNIKKVSTGLLLIAAGLSSADAAITTFNLGSHPKGQKVQPEYGLRLDGLFQNGNKPITFDFGDTRSDMKLDFDSVNNEIKIYGKAWGGTDTGSAYDSNATLWDINFTYDANVSEISGPDAGDYGYKVTAANSSNSGTISDGTNTYNLNDKYSDNFGFSFQFDNFTDHRLNGTGLSGPETFTGHGWVMHNGHNSDLTSDWLFTGTAVPAVPEPSTYAMFGLAGVMLGFASYRSRNRRS